MGRLELRSQASSSASPHCPLLSPSAWPPPCLQFVGRSHPCCKGARPPDAQAAAGHAAYRPAPRVDFMGILCGRAHASDSTFANDCERVVRYPPPCGVSHLARRRRYVEGESCQGRAPHDDARGSNPNNAADGRAPCAQRVDAGRRRQATPAASPCPCSISSPPLTCWVCRVGFVLRVASGGDDAAASICHVVAPWWLTTKLEQLGAHGGCEVEVGGAAATCGVIDLQRQPPPRDEHVGGQAGGVFAWAEAWAWRCHVSCERWSAQGDEQLVMSWPRAENHAWGSSVVQAT